MSSGKRRRVASSPPSSDPTQLLDPTAPRRCPGLARRCPGLARDGEAHPTTVTSAAEDAAVTVHHAGSASPGAGLEAFAANDLLATATEEAAVRRTVTLPRSSAASRRGRVARGMARRPKHRPMSPRAHLAPALALAASSKPASASAAVSRSLAPVDGPSRVWV